MPASNGLAAIARESATSQAARQIRGAILAGTLPIGSRLREQALAAELGISRGPVREALQRLVQEGLAVAEPNRGVFVALLTDFELADVFVARFAVEQTAAAIIASRRDGEDRRGIADLLSLVDRMAAAASVGNWPRVADLDIRFHEALVRLSRSPRLVRGFSTLSAETRIGVMRQERSYSEPRDLVDEHRRIVTDLAEGSSTIAAEAIRHHMAVSIRNLELDDKVPGYLTLSSPD